jgi:hypothetical protein
LTDERAFARVLPVLTNYLSRPAETLRAPPPKAATKAAGAGFRPDSGYQTT